MRTACIVFVVLFALFGILYLVYGNEMHEKRRLTELGAAFFGQTFSARELDDYCKKERQTRDVFGFLAVTSGLIAIVTAILAVSRKRSSETG